MKNNVEDIYELSPLQHGMLFHTLYAPQSGAYVEQFAWSIGLTLNLDAFKRAWQRVIERQAALRTGFNWQDLDKPLQIVYREIKLPWEQHDWRKLSSTDVDERIQKFLSADRRRGFELNKAPLMRLVIFRTADAYQLILSHHHILMDGWCGPLIMAEVFAFYEAFCRKEELNLPQPRSYRDYITWLQKQDKSQAKSFWQKTLASFTTPTALGIDKSPGSFLGKEGTYADQMIELPAKVTSDLQSFARKHGITFNTLVQSAWGLLLSHYSTQADVVFGTVVSGRPVDLVGIETMTGLFVNTLPMRMTVSPQAELLTWLKGIQDQQVEMRQYEYTPLVNVHGWSAVPRGIPMFESILVFENYPGLNTANTTLKLSNFRAFEQTNYPLTVLVMPGTFIKIIYDSQRFAAADIVKLLQHFQNLLERIVSLPLNSRLTDLHPLSEMEQRQILVDWNATQAAFPENAGLHTLFEAQAQRTPEALAVTFQEESLTYQQLNHKADQLAHFLQSQGVGPDTLVGLYIERSLDMMVGLLGILKAGGAYVPFDPTYPQERLAFMLDDSQVRLLLTQKNLLETLPHYTGQTVCLDAATEIFSQQNLACPIQATAENLAYVLYTSGSTGKPKGVQISHRAVINLLEAMRCQPGFSQQDVLLAVTTLSFDIAGLELFLPLIVGGKVVLVSREEAVDEVRLPARIKESRATVMQATPVTWKLLLDAGWKGEPNLAILCGGEALPADLANPLTQCGKALWNMYGPTETTIWSAVYPVCAQATNILPIGRPIANTEMYILNQELRPVPIGVPGDLYIGGKGLARGYWHLPALTAEKFIPNPFEDSGTRLYATGDLARYLPDGNIEFLGRIDHQIKLRGLRIELGEIESVLRQHPGVRNGVVLVRRDQHGSEQLVGYLVPNWNYHPGTPDVEKDAEQTSAWQAIWDETYNQLSHDQDPTFNISGWNSSYTGQPIPSEEMCEWVDNTVERILSLHPKRALEIGCGTGLLLFRIAPACTQYLGADFSAQVLEALQPTLEQQNIPQATLSKRMADDFSGIEPGSLDTVIINSVIQYFPSIEYLVRVLQGAVNAVADGGSVYVGDVRSLPLLEAFHTSIQLARISPTSSIEELRQHMHTSLSQEKELVIDPAFFIALKQHLPQIGHVEILPKLGSARNELTKFRYDVILHVGKSIPDGSEPGWLAWNDQTTLSTIRQVLVEEQPAAIGISQIPNARVLVEAQIAEWLSDEKRDGAVGEWLTASQELKGVDINDLRQLANERNYTLHLNWSGAGKSFDAVFRSAGGAPVDDNHVFVAFPEETTPIKPWHEYAQKPIQNTEIRALLMNLHQFLEDKLPEYMVPSLLMVLEKMPLTPNGKIDRRALPVPGESRPAAAGEFIAPVTETEGKLARIWQRLLGVNKIGRNDSFFDLGGHSLTEIQLVNRIRENFNVEVPLRTSYQLSTIAELAEHIDKERQQTQTKTNNHVE